MFEGQPKGLYALALANTGERFGYYTMLAIFTLFLQAKFGYTATETSNIFSSFLAGVYFMPFIGGILADKYGYGKMVTLGVFIMFFGYILLAIPTAADASGKAMMFGALTLIACGTGLFKGNLQVMVGNLYDAPEYQNKRDTAFSLFYMAINIGALYAPTAATKVTNYVLGMNNLSYNAQIPALAHQYLDNPGAMTTQASAMLESLKMEQGFSGDTATFCQMYIDKLAEAYNYGFGVACISLIVSILIYYAFRSTFKHADYNAKTVASNEQHHVQEELSPAETKQRITALCLVFAVVLFFWMAFHQNGLTLTFFARDYTEATATGLNVMGFDVINLTLLIILVYGLFALFQGKTGKEKTIAGLVSLASVAILGAQYYTKADSVEILPQIFQQFNPFFVVALTPFSLALFGHLARKGKEPSAPRKIGLGMLIAALGFAIMAYGSVGLPTPNALADGVTFDKVSPNWLISTYLILTFAELLLSPMGISFVSKVAPPKYKGMMMGGWFVATAIGNYMVAIIGYLWGDIQLWIVWSVLIVLCLLSALFIFSIMKKLEKVA